jgi:UDP-glucuronate decarboxylase
MMRMPDATPGPANLGNPDEFTMSGLAELVLQMTGSPSQIINRPLPVDDPRQRRPDISVATSMLGWKPRIKLQEGLLKTIDYFRNELWLAPIALEASA